jgi:hypothetical protein
MEGWKEVVVTKFKVISWHLPVWTEKMRKTMTNLVVHAHVDGMRLCLCTVATNGPTVHPPDDMQVWRLTME